MRTIRNVSFLVLLVVALVVTTDKVRAGCEVDVGGTSQLHEGYDPESAMAECQWDAENNCESLCIAECGSSEMGGQWDGCSDWDPHPTYVESVGRCFCQADLE